MPVGYPLYVEVGYGAVGIPVGAARLPMVVSPYKTSHGGVRPEHVRVGYGAVGIPVASLDRLPCRLDTRWRERVTRDADVWATEARGLGPLDTR